MLKWINFLFMAKREKETLLPDNEIIEVVMRKKMTVAEYEKILKNGRTKGWSVQAYQEGVYSDGLGKKV